MGRGNGSGRGRGRGLGEWLSNQTPAARVGLFCCTTVVLIVGVILFASSFQVIRPWQYGLHFNRLTVKIEEDRVYGGGRYFKGVGHFFETYPRRNQYVEFSDSSDGGAQNLPIVVWSRDGQEIVMEVGFYFRIVPERLHDLYFTYGHNYLPVIEDVARSTLRIISTEFDTISFFSERDVINDRMFEAFRQEAERVVGVEIPKFFILALDVPAGFTAAVEDKVVVAQEKVVLEVEREAAVIRKTIEVVQAEASRNVSIINTNATAQGTIVRKRAEADAAVQIGAVRAQQYNETAFALGFVKQVDAIVDGQPATVTVPEVQQVLQLIYTEFLAGEDTGGAPAKLYINYPSLLLST